MLVLAMQFSRSVGVGPNAQHPGHEDAGAATRWPCRRRLEDVAVMPLLQNRRQDSASSPSSTAGRDEPYDQRCRLDPIERGSNWESPLQCARALTP